MNKCILTGELVAHVGDGKTDGGADIHQATLKSFEPWLQGKGHEEFHPLVLFNEDARRARELPLGSRLLIQATIRWAPTPGLHVHGLEIL